MSAALVLGGTGGLGAAVSRLLESRGREVITVARREADVVGDVTQPLLGLPPEFLSTQGPAISSVVWAVGRVDWVIGPNEAVQIHQTGVRNLGALLDRLPSVERVVYVSSVLALGRAVGPISSSELHRGQTFRNWYEFGKYLGEEEARKLARPHDVRILRFGPLVGPERPDTETGLGAVIPYLEQGFPAHMEDRGRFPAYGGSLFDAAEAICAALSVPDFPAVSTWVDPSLPSLAAMIRGLCARFGFQPRIVDQPWLRRATGLIGSERFGLPPELLAYSQPLPELDLTDEREFQEHSGLNLMATPTAVYLDGAGPPGSIDLTAEVKAVAG